MAKLDASLGRSIAGGTAVPSASAIAREGPPLPRSAPSSAIAAAVGRSIARPTNGGSGEYQYDVRLQMLQARRLALHRGSRPIRTFEDGFAGPSNDAEAQAELPTPPSPTLETVRSTFIRLAPPPSDLPDADAIRAAFDAFDLDGSGALSRRELRKARR